MVSDGVEASVGLVKGLSPMTLQETEPRGSPAVAMASTLPLRHSQPFQKAYSLEPPATHWAVDPEAIREVGGGAIPVPVHLPRNCVHLLFASRRFRTWAPGGGIAVPEHHG